MGVLINSVLLFYFCSCVLLPNNQCQETVDILLSHEYANLSTKGNLIPNLYRVPINQTRPPPAIRVVVTSENSIATNPLTLVAVKGKSILNVHLPRIQTHDSQSFEYWFSADTMCEDVTTEKQLYEPVRISVASSEPAVYTLRVKAVYDFDIGNTIIATQATPPEPRFHRFTFPDGVDQVSINVTSNSDICGKVIARKASVTNPNIFCVRNQVQCPVFDSSGIVEMSNVFYYQCFSRNAFFHVKRKDIGPEFHVIFTVMPDDMECETKPNLTNNKYRIKEATISVKVAKDVSMLAILPLLVYLITTLIVLIATYIHCRWLDRQENNEPSVFDVDDTERTVVISQLELFEAPTLTVSHKQYEKQRVIKESKYFNFFYFQIFGAMLPSMTTLFHNRLLRFKVLNLDACNINFQCTFEFLGFRYFNGMASASSLVFLGIVNLLLVFRKKIFPYSTETRQMFPTHGLHQQDAPKVVCILSMIALGLFWTVTSSCPQKTTLHLYVYTIVWVCLSAMMWIYSKRHAVRKWQQTFILVVSSVLAIFTFSEKNLETGTIGTIVMKSLLGLFINIVTAYFCYKFCYERPSGIQEHQWISSPFYCGEKVLCDEKGVYQPLKSNKYFAIVLMLWSFVWSMIVPFAFPYFNQTKIILRLVQVDLMLYLFFYLIQKIRFERKSFTRGYLFYLTTFFTMFILSLAAWGAIVAYKNPSFVAWSAARSRTLNNPCVVPGVDWNDILHYVSSLICILFIFLLDFIDTNLKSVPKKYIFVF